MYKNKGFTLIELLIVIAIIGILAAAILPRFAAVDIKARDATTRANLAALRGALIQYRAVHGAWPNNLHLLVPLFIERIPPELLSSPGCNTVITVGGPDTAGMLNNAIRHNNAVGWVYANYDPVNAETSRGRTILPARTVPANGDTSSTTNDW